MTTTVAPSREVAAAMRRYRVGAWAIEHNREEPKRSGGLEGGLQPDARSLEPSFEAR